MFANISSLGYLCLYGTELGGILGTVHTSGKFPATPLFGSRCVRETENLSYSSDFLSIQWYLFLGEEITLLSILQ